MLDRSNAQKHRLQTGKNDSEEMIHMHTDQIKREVFCLRLQHRAYDKQAHKITNITDKRKMHVP